MVLASSYRIRTLTLATLLVAWGLFACTDVEIEVDVPIDNDKLAVEGEFCTTDPSQVNYTTRILFLVDCSDSMRWNDPLGTRAQAIKEIIDMYKEAESVVFGVIRFGSEVVVETESYTKYEDELDKALKPMLDENDPSRYLGGTDYNLVLKEATDFIEKDHVMNPQEKDADYITVFITDGAPQAGNSDPADTVKAILDQVRTLSELDTVLHTLMLSTELMGVPPEFLTILQAMAAQGKGEYREMSGPSGLAAALGDLLDMTLILRIYELKQMFVLNRNVTLIEENGEAKVVADSDGDGLADIVEQQLGTSPQLADSDGDRISDLVEVRIGYDPLAQEQLEIQPDDFTDLDSDGLLQIEERLLGTNPNRFDTDVDGIPDLLEVRFDTNPLKDDERGDYDSDFDPNLDEIKANTNPRFDETGKQDDLSLFYAVYFIGRNGGQCCYRFEIDNITLRTTLGTDSSPTGRNLIELMVVDVPMENKELMGNITHSSVEIIYRSGGYRKPNALTMFLDPDDFK